MTPSRLVVLVSGEGTNLQALIDAIAAGVLDARIVLVVSSRPGAGALVRAAAARIPWAVRPLRKAPALEPAAARAAYDAALADEILGWKPDFVLLLGWMRVLGEAFVSRFPGKIVNLHPALPGSFPGVGAIERAYESWRAGGPTESGVMTHFVPDSGVDSGPLIDLERVEIAPGSSLPAFEADMHAAEHRLVVRTLRRLLAGGQAERGE